MEKNIDILKENWKRLNDVSAVESGAASPDASTLSDAAHDHININKKTVSRRSRMIRIYRILFVVAMVYILVGPFVLKLAGLPIWCLILISLYFAMMALFCWGTLDRIRKINPVTQSVLEALHAVEAVIWFRRIGQIVGLSAAIPLIIVMLYLFRVDEALFLGGVCGAIIGMVIGVVQDREIRGILREIRRELMEAYS